MIIKFCCIVIVYKSKVIGIVGFIVEYFVFDYSFIFMVY